MKKALFSKHSLMFLLLGSVLFYVADVSAAIDNAGVFDNVLRRYEEI